LIELYEMESEKEKWTSFEPGNRRLFSLPVVAALRPADRPVTARKDFFRYRTGADLIPARFGKTSKQDAIRHGIHST